MSWWQIILTLILVAWLEKPIVRWWQNRRERKKTEAERKRENAKEWLKLQEKMDAIDRRDQARYEQERLDFKAMMRCLDPGADPTQPGHPSNQ